MKKIVNTTLLILLIVFISSCSTKRHVKNKPLEGSWEKCPLCKGSGIAEIYSSGESSDDIRNRDDGTDFCIGTGLGCIFIQRIIDYESDEAKANNNDPKTHAEKDYKEQMKNNIPEKSIVKREVKCPRCSGIGWIERHGKYYGNSEFDPHEYETLKRIKKEINR